MNMNGEKLVAELDGNNLRSLLDKLGELKLSEYYSFKDNSKLPEADLVSIHDLLESPKKLEFDDEIGELYVINNGGERKALKSSYLRSFDASNSWISSIIFSIPSVFSNSTTELKILFN